MEVVKSILHREFKSYFASPIALIFLCVFLVLTGFFTFKLGGFYDQGQADLRSFFVWHPWLYLFIVPAVSMRLWAEERRTGTIELLLTLPVSITQAMLGKFLAAWLFIAISLVLTFPILFTVYYLGEPDSGVIFAGYIGSYLMAGAFLAIGCALSACTSNQVISFVLSTFVSLFLILLGSDPVVNTIQTVLPPALVSQIVNLSFPYHFEAIQRGVINMSDVVYFLSVIVLSLWIGIVVIERKKAD